MTRPESRTQVPASVNSLRMGYTTDLDILVATLAGHQAFNITRAVSAPIDLLEKLILAAEKVRVPYVFPNYWGFDPGVDALTRDSLLEDVRDEIYTAYKKCLVSRYILLSCDMWYNFGLAAGGPDRCGFDFGKGTFIQFDNQDTPMTVTTWPQCDRTITVLLSLDMEPNEAGSSPALSQFAKTAVLVQSFRITQRQMFESVKRVTRTEDKDLTISDEVVWQRYQDGFEGVQSGNFHVFRKMLCGRQFFDIADADRSSFALVNEVLGLPVETLDEATAVAIRMGEQGEVAL